MSLMAANEESDPSAILNGFWVTLLFSSSSCCSSTQNRNAKPTPASLTPKSSEATVWDLAFFMTL